MIIRRVRSEQPVVIERAVVEDPRISAVALAVYVYLATDDGLMSSSEVVERFGLDEAEVAAAIAQLTEAGLVDGGAS